MTRNAFFRPASGWRQRLSAVCSGLSSAAQHPSGARKPYDAARDGPRRPGHRPDPPVGYLRREIIWISSGLRRPASGPRDSRVLPGWIGLEFLGFSRQKLAFSMGYKRPGANLIFGRPFPSEGGAKAGRCRFAGRPRQAARRAEVARQVEDHDSRHRKGPIGHCGQTNAVFSFLQGNIDLARFSENFGARSRCGPGP